MVCATNEGLFASCSSFKPDVLRFTSTSTDGQQECIELPLNITYLAEVAASDVSA